VASSSLTAASMPSPLARGVWGEWLKRNFFAGPLSTALTVLLAVAVIWFGPRIFAWAVLDAVFVADDAGACRQASGACWAVIAEKHRLMLFGTYPYDQQWRGALCVGIIVAMIVISTMRRFWSMRLLAVWAAAIAAALLLQFGGIFGLSYVPTSRWGGLPLTMLLFVGTIALGLPLAILLALGRRSELPAVRAVSAGYVEIIRGIPLVNVLFMATLLFPLFLPEGVNFDKLLRAQVAIILFFAAYTAEVVRGGLQAVSRGQYEAADSLGVSYWERTIKIILPQALRIVIPALVNDVIRAFKNTSLLVVIGLFDLLGGTMAALEDPSWSRYYLEAYLFIAAIYFAFCFWMSQYSQWLERHFSRGRNL
jgi:general L-amino acid transport system permease protein